MLEQAAYDTERSQEFTPINEQPTRKDWDKHHEEVQICLTTAGVPVYAWSGKCGPLGELLKDAKYTHITGGLVSVDKVEPGPYDPGIDKNVSNYDRGLMKAKWDQTCES